MLSDFDILRRARTGTDLLATLKWLNEGHSVSGREMELGAPFSILDGPCNRCWIYRRSPGRMHCDVCSEILGRKRGLDQYIRQMVVIWGYVTTIPILCRDRKWPGKKRASEAYVCDGNCFVIMIHRHELLPLLKEMGLRHGEEIQGLLQIFPTVGMDRVSMGDVLCRAIHYERSYPLDRVRVRFYSHPFQLRNPHLREAQGMLTFDFPRFLDHMELAVIFRALLSPAQQKDLYDILTEAADAREQGFYWGRFSGQISDRAKDMLDGWDVRQWSRSRIDLTYELMNYVAFSPSD